MGLPDGGGGRAPPCKEAADVSGHPGPPPTFQGTAWVENSRFRFSRTPAVVRRAGAPIGEDTYAVLHDLLGYDDDRIADLAAAELLE